MTASSGRVVDVHLRLLCAGCARRRVHDRGGHHPGAQRAQRAQRTQRAAAHHCVRELAGAAPSHSGSMRICHIHSVYGKCAGLLPYMRLCLYAWAVACKCASVMVSSLSAANQAAWPPAGWLRAELPVLLHGAHGPARQPQHRADCGAGLCMILMHPFLIGDLSAINHHQRSCCRLTATALVLLSMPSKLIGT